MANIDENVANMKILVIISRSDSGPLARISLTSVAGALLSLDAINRKSSHIVTGLVLTCLCSTIFFTLERNKKEFITAGRRAITPIISEFPTIDKPAYIDPNNNVPESPRKILLGNL
jgi:hypothetical protein